VQKKKQIPRGNDRKKSKSNGKSNYKSNYKSNGKSNYKSNYRGSVRFAQDDESLVDASEIKCKCNSNGKSNGSRDGWMVIC
jgi:hypothetical protein